MTFFGGTLPLQEPSLSYHHSVLPEVSHLTGLLDFSVPALRVGFCLTVSDKHSCPCFRPCFDLPRSIPFSLLTHGVLHYCLYFVSCHNSLFKLIFPGIHPLLFDFLCVLGREIVTHFLYLGINSWAVARDDLWWDVVERQRNKTWGSKPPRIDSDSFV